MADAGDSGGEGHWLTYGQLAEARKIGRRAAVRLAQRHRLRRQPGNDGSVRVWVPADMAASSPFRPFPPATAEADTDDTQAADATPFHVQALAALEAALRSADARADAASALAERLAAELADAGVRADRAEQALAAERGRADKLRDQLDAAEASAEQAEARGDRAQVELERARAAGREALQAAEALRQAEIERRAMGLLARLVAALRAE